MCECLHSLRVMGDIVLLDCSLFEVNLLLFSISVLMEGSAA